MAEQLDTLIKDFEFIEENRSQLVFSDPRLIRLDPKRNVVELKRDEFGKFPTAADINVISPLFQPKGVREWSVFQAFIAHVFDGLVPITADGFRLHDGTDQFFWNGSSWVVNTTSWNTEAEVANNIDAFPVTARKLRVVVNLATTDPDVTPSLSMAKVAWKAKIRYLEDIIYRTLAPALRGLRFATDFAFDIPFPGGLQLDLGAVVEEVGIPFNLVDVDSIFNHGTDPDHLTNLLSSFDSSSLKATLTTSIPVGNLVFAQLLVEPEVSIESTSPDFIEVEKTPALVVTDIDAVDSSPLNQDDHVTNKDTGDAIRVKPPYRFDIRFTMIAIAPGAVDLIRFKEAVAGFMENNPTLRSDALDREYRLWLVDEFSTLTRPNNQGLHSAQGTFMIKDVLAYLRPAVQEIAILRLLYGGSLNANVPFGAAAVQTLDERSFLFTVPSDGVDFTAAIPTPGMRDNTYAIAWSYNTIAVGGSSGTELEFPQADRTSTTFKIKADSTLKSGTTIDFILRDRA